jgi:hypothetical protein
MRFAVCVLALTLASGDWAAGAGLRSEISAAWSLPADTCHTAGRLKKGRGAKPGDGRPFGAMASYDPTARVGRPRGPFRGLDRSEGEPKIVPGLYGASADGNVVGLARSGSTLYIAGSFRSVGQNTGGYVPVDARTGEPLRAFPKVAGSVRAIVSDGEGGWYIGGRFSAVEGKPRACLAQIRADGSVSDWNPVVSGHPDFIDPPAVTALAVDQGRVYVGGTFAAIGGRSQESLGCVDARTGASLAWNHGTNIDGWVATLAVDQGTVFVGGFFDSLGGEPRVGIGAVDAATGNLLPWRADAVGYVLAVLVKGDTLLLGGNFLGINFTDRPMLAAVDVHTGQLLPFDVHAEGVHERYLQEPQVTALSLIGDTLFAAGNFTRIGGKYRPSLAALNVHDGTAFDWAPDTLGPRFAGFPPPLVRTMAMSRGSVYLGGGFDSVGEMNRTCVAELNRATGKVTPWGPKPDDVVWALAVQGDTVLAGGTFSTVGEWRHRAGLAALDLTTGRLKPWNPNPNGVICTAIAVHGDRVLVSGDFSQIGGQPRPHQYFAALDTINGEALDWDPRANDIADTFLLVDDTLYMGGVFTQMGGQTRNYAAAISATTGEVLPWNPNPDDWVLALARGGGVIYLGGIFFHVGAPRHGIAAVDATTGLLSSWNPDTDNSVVEALLVGGDKVYVGGGFGRIGGQPRTSIAALDVNTGLATEWNPQPTPWEGQPRVKSLALAGGKLYVGGAFGGIGGQPRTCFAAVDTSTGLATDWDPGADGMVWSLLADGNMLYVGGGFTRTGGWPAAGVAAFSLPPPAVPVPEGLALTQSIPNPAGVSALIRFSLPSAAPVTLSVYDLQGRQIAVPLDHVYQEAGPHEVVFLTDQLKAGVYLYSVNAGGQSATRKMVVVR